MAPESEWRETPARSGNKKREACPEGSAEGKVAGGHEIENIPPPGWADYGKKFRNAAADTVDVCMQFELKITLFHVWRLKFIGICSFLK